ncbi:recombinase family protein [Micromonospora sp. NPDC005305]|uniref:recombinase family protein n=1 Tax=Micromonospora sp. NPDC005305 TaxID=3156875 RepID=UPI0033AEA871
MSPLQVRAAGYVRQSKARENKSEASPATQRDANRARAEQMKATWVGSYEDLGISAFSGAERPGFERLIADCRAGRVNTIIVYYVSRFSRADPLDAIPVVTDLLNRGVTIISVTEGEFRKGNLMDLIHLIMRLDAAHSESKNKSIAVKGAKDAAKALGGYTSGKPPYGFALSPETRTNADGRPIAVQILTRRDDEAAVIRDMVARVLDPVRPAPLLAVTRWLNESDVPTRGATVGKVDAGSQWSPRTLARILRDPRIAGFGAEVVYTVRPDGRKSTGIAGYRIIRDEEGKPVKAHPEIIDPATWYELQDRLAGRTPQTAPTASPAPSLLSSLGILHCGCGARMKSHRRNDSLRWSAYRCTRPVGVRQPDQHAGDCTVQQDLLDDYVARRIFALIATADTADDLDVLETIAEATRLFGLASADPATAAQRGAIAGELDDAERSLDTLYDDRKKGGYSGTIGQRRFLEEERALGGRIETLTAQLAAIDATASPTLPIGEWLGEPGEDPIGPGSWWDRAALPERRAMVALFVRRITVAKAPTLGRRTPVASRVSIAWVRPTEEN